MKLRRATVSEAGPGDGPEQDLTVELDGRLRPAIADVALVGQANVGDEVIVNVQALDLELGSGGFDIVHVNLTRGLQSTGATGANVMKLNYTSLQHTVTPVEQERLSTARRATGSSARPSRSAGRGRVGVRAWGAGEQARVRSDRGWRAAGRALAHGAHPA